MDTLDNIISKINKVIYSNKGGLGIILDIDDKESDYFDNTSVIINGKELIPGCHTNLDGIFDNELRFVGNLKDDTKCMVFHLGDDADLFDFKRYYSCFYWISETRICNKYTHDSARDFNYIDGQWK